MRNLLKKWALAAAVLSVTMFQGGCLGISWQWFTAYLNEDLFG